MRKRIFRLLALFSVLLVLFVGMTYQIHAISVSGEIMPQKDGTYLVRIIFPKPHLRFVVVETNITITSEYPTNSLKFTIGSDQLDVYRNGITIRADSDLYEVVFSLLDPNSAMEDQKMVTYYSYGLILVGLGVVALSLPIRRRNGARRSE